MECKEQVEVYVGVNYDRLIHVQCGRTGPYPSVELCESCQEKAMTKYPQGWRCVPGDVCRHGAYHDPRYDACCFKCEEGE